MTYNEMIQMLLYRVKPNAKNVGPVILRYPSKSSSEHGTMLVVRDGDTVIDLAKAVALRNIGNKIVLDEKGDEVFPIDIICWPIENIFFFPLLRMCDSMGA